MTTSRKIIHCDCDCFYASVEMRDDPSLVDLPLAVGGAAERRGVISTCNYVAREFGIHSAMPSAYARQLCPGLVILPPRFDKYRLASTQIRQIFYDYTELVEPLSLDEAYLDVTAADQLKGSATLIARDIRRRVKAEVGITLSTGIAPNKFLAKVASDWNKPDGEYVVLPNKVADFVKQLPVKRIFGVGKVTASKLERMNISTCGDLQALDVFELTKQFGSFGARLYELARGEDARAVTPTHRRKSLSVENTYSADIDSIDACLSALQELIVKLKSRLRHIDDNYLVVKQFIKLKFNNFSTTTVESSSRRADHHLFEELTRQGFERVGLPVRLIGVGVRFVDLHQQADPAQLELFEKPGELEQEVAHNAK